MDENVLQDALAHRAETGGAPNLDFVDLLDKCGRVDRLIAVKKFAAAGTALAVAVAIGLSVRGPSADGTVGVETASNGRDYEAPEKDEPKATTTTEKKVVVVPTTVEKPPVTEKPKETPPTTEKKVEQPPATDAPKETVPPVTEKPKETPPTTKPPVEEVAFTALATYGSCAEPVPYDVYYGTANPGAKVKVQSEYGWGYTYADADGQWELRVEFPTAPVGTPFTVKVITYQGLVELEFTRTA